VTVSKEFGTGSKSNINTTTQLAWLIFDYKKLGAHQWPPFDGQTGINYCGAEIKTSQITDGLSKTYMLGEKYLPADKYDADGPTTPATWRQHQHVPRL